MTELASDGDTALTRVHHRAHYTADEQRFSCMVQARLQDLLEGKLNTLPLLRRYPHDPDRLGVMVMPPDIARDELRLQILEALTWHAVDFFRPSTNGGPIAQRVGPDGTIVEQQMFATRFPHIIVRRTDRYRDGESDPEEIIWCLERVQNQRQQTQINRLLDAANLGLELIKIFRP